jgi:hypothetical protein
MQDLTNQEMLREWQLSAAMAAASGARRSGSGSLLCSLADAAAFIDRYCYEPMAVPAKL